jgi:uncharacterized membrane protein SirB2
LYLSCLIFILFAEIAMNKKTKRTFVRVISYSVAAVAVLGGFLLQANAKMNDLKNQAIALQT